MSSQQINDLLFRLQQLKHVARQNHVGDRPENPAEHSWGVAMLALLLSDVVPEIDLERVLKLVIVHDTCEIGIGDECHYDVDDHDERSRRERENIRQLFHDRPEMFALWEEFEANSTPEARFVQSLDKIEPIIQNLTERGVSWKRHKRSRSTVLEYKMEFVIPELRPLLIQLVDLATEQGYLLNE